MKEKESLKCTHCILVILNSLRFRLLVEKKHACLLCSIQKIKHFFSKDLHSQKLASQSLAEVQHPESLFDADIHRQPF